MGDKHHKTVLRCLHTTRKNKDASDTPDRFVIKVSPDSLCHWDVVIMGPTDSVYAGGFFHLTVDFNDKFPFDPPDIKLQTKIYHFSMGEEASGSSAVYYICFLNGHDFKDRWSPVFINSMDKLFDWFIQELREPGTHGPHISGGGSHAVFLANREEYDARARQWTQDYALDESLYQEALSSRHVIVIQVANVDEQLLSCTILSGEEVAKFPADMAIKQLHEELVKELQCSVNDTVKLVDESGNVLNEQS